MIPTKQQCEELHRKYASSDKHFELCWTHCVIVAEIALRCVDEKSLEVDRAMLEAACLLHDIGAYMLMNEDGEITSYYNLHAIFGSKILEEEGVDERIQQAVENHVMLGMTADDYKKTGWANPFKDYIPSTVEQRLVNYGDRFHSKVPIFNSLDSIKAKLTRVSPDKLQTLEKYVQEFGLPDLHALADKYNHPIA